MNQNITALLVFGISVTEGDQEASMTPRRFSKIKSEGHWRDLETMTASAVYHDRPITPVQQSRPPAIAQTDQQAVEPASGATVPLQTVLGMERVEWRPK